MFKIICKMFMVLLSNIVNGFNHTIGVSLCNQKYMIKLNFVNLNHNEYS